MNKIKNFPIGFVTTWVGAITLSNTYLSLGFPAVRHFFMIGGIAVALAIILKVILFPAQCKKEYQNPVLASFYPAIPMILMLIGSYLQPYTFLGKYLWLFAIALHAVLILVFTIRHVLLKFDYATFIPSWFVTYFGIMVSSAIGLPMNEPKIMNVVVVYGLVMFCIVFLALFVRLIKDGLPAQFTHTRTIFLAPVSLCLVGYLNFFSPNIMIVSILAIFLVGFLLHVVYYIPRFFAVSFVPTFAALTFPMAIALVASAKTSVYFMQTDYTKIGFIFSQIAGFQLILTTVFVMVVIFNFLKVIFKKEQAA